MESLDIILTAWTNDRFSYEGKYYQFDNVCVIPKPYQKPHPPLRIAATTKETFPQVGRAGMSVFVGLRGMDRPTLANSLDEYRAAWRGAGHAAIPASSCASRCTWARPTSRPMPMRRSPRCGPIDGWPRASQQRFRFRSHSRRGAHRARSPAIRHHLRGPAARPPGLRHPDTVSKLLREIVDELGLSGVVAEVNVGGGISRRKCWLGHALRHQGRPGLALSHHRRTLPARAEAGI